MEHNVYIETFFDSKNVLDIKKCFNHQNVFDINTIFWYQKHFDIKQITEHYKLTHSVYELEMSKYDTLLRTKYSSSHVESFNEIKQNNTEWEISLKKTFKEWFNY